MSIWPFNRDKTWDSLSREKQLDVARKIGALAMSMFDGQTSFAKGFEAVGETSSQRRPAYIETKGEDEQITASQRAQLSNLQRDMLRNSPTRLSMDQQIRVNVVGSVGGKLYASFPKEYRDAANEVMSYFNNVWFPRAEFTFGKNFNWLLKTCLTAQDTDGNVVLVFDDGILTGGSGTGRIRGFEGDELGEVPDFEKRFPQGFVQRRGFVYNRSGMFCGCFASTSQRGRKVLDPALGVFTLRMDPMNPDEDPNWIVLGDMRRFNQGRAISPLTAAITCLIDLHETLASETQAAKINSKIVGQILEEGEEEDGEDLGVPSAFSPVDAGQGQKENGPKTVKFSTKELKAIGAIFTKMPKRLKIDLLDSKRPNPNMSAFIDYLTGLAGGTKGLARVYSCLKAQTSYTAYRGEQQMTEPSFEEARTDLERLTCDWAARHVIRRAVKLGLIKSELPDGWERMIAWNWPKMREVSEKDAQTALKLKLQNGVTTLHRELGPGEYERIREERRQEAADAKEDGIIYQPAVTVAGAIAENADEPEDKTEPEASGEENNEGGANADE